MVVFFSSRRRHTRYWRDWSSDVCSSDLYKAIEALNVYKLMPVSGSTEEAIAQSYHDLFLQHNSDESILEYQHGESKLKSEGAHSLDQMAMPPVLTGTQCRSEERRVGKECRSRWSPYH